MAKSENKTPLSFTARLALIFLRCYLVGSCFSRDLLFTLEGSYSARILKFTFGFNPVFPLSVYPASCF